MNRGVVGVVLVLGVAAGLAACSSGESSSGAPAVAPYQAESSGAAKDSAGGGAPGKPGEKGKVDTKQPGVDRALVRTARMELVTADVSGVVGRARDVAAGEGGYVGREQVRDDSATLTLHIPSDRFDRALGELSGLGRVTTREQSADDVTEQVVDLESRVATQRASVERIRTLLAKATTVDEIARIEQELTTREADLESLEQRRQALAGQVALSTVTVRVGRTAAPAPVKDESSGFLAGLSDGWGAFLDAGGVTLRVIGAMLPFLLVLAVPAAFVIWRRRRRAVAVQQP